MQTNMLVGQMSTGLFFASTVLSNFMFTQFMTANDIPSNYFTEKQVIYGRVERVIDGDTLRVTHCPTISSCPERDANIKLSDTTISVRLFGIDCPELQKRSSDPPSQLFAKEAKDLTSRLTLGKTVELELLGRDKYGRALSKVQTPIGQDVSLELTSRGLATMYTGKGALYDENKMVVELVEDRAKAEKIGMWSLGDNMITPAEFKRQQKEKSKL
mmetsp:Transcript_28311/g.42815  ORF Transcript_28311/g.42815 Transcript_28311/m.42815 type:complete len:215 (+) Transcript_28311:164-808(+)